MALTPNSVAHQSGRARSGGLEIHFRKLGKKGKTPLLVVHGLQYFSWDWLGVAQALTETYLEAGLSLLVAFALLYAILRFMPAGIMGKGRLE